MAENKILNHITKNNRVFYKLIDLQRISTSWREELNELHKQGLINKRNGINGVVIQKL